MTLQFDVTSNNHERVHYRYKNDEEIDFSYESGFGKAENELVFTVRPNDNEAVYRCEASNRVTPKPLTTQVKLTVQCKYLSVCLCTGVRLPTG